MLMQVRNWGYTLFYCSAELWGDVVLSLLFWGLANETTSMSEAPLLYPLYGIGANIGQAVSGRLLSFFSSMTSQRMGYATQMQASLCCAFPGAQPNVLGMGEGEVGNACTPLTRKSQKGGFMEVDCRLARAQSGCFESFLEKR